jgi:hypothetical protein
MRVAFGAVGAVVVGMLVAASGCGLDGPVPSARKAGDDNRGAATPAVETPLPRTSSGSRVRAASAPVIETKEWRADPALMDQLQPYQDVEGFEIRLPRELKFCIRQVGPLPGLIECTWTGSLRTDGSKPTLLLKLITPPPAAAAAIASATLEDGLEGVMPPNGVRGPDYHQESVEMGQINGISFARVKFRFTWSGTQRIVRGASYSGKQGGTFIGLRMHDYDPYQEESMKLLNAAVMTLRKK